MPCLIPALLLCLGALGPGNQTEARVDPDADPFRRLILVGSVEEDRIRLGQLLGRESTHGFLLRSPSTLSGPPDTPDPGEGRAVVSVIPPELHAVWNSDLPFSMNEGPMWAGRGLSSRLTLGARLTYREVTLVLAPQVIHEENRDFQTFSRPENQDPRQRHLLASPFHYPPGSMDLPQRFGTESRSFLDPGQSSVTVRRGPVAFGAATENLWWGPGIRNGLLMSSNAPGFPHLFLRPAAPLETRIGTIEGRWMVGRVSESRYFDFNPENDHRSLSALAVVVNPSFDPDLSIGFSRAVYAPSGGALFPLGAAFDVLRGVGRPSAEPGDTLLAPGPDQLFTLFARWVFPEAGFEAYGEWGRSEQPANLRELLEVPQHSRGYTLGLQYARAAPRLPATLRIQGEITNLEPSSSFRVRAIPEWYASRRVPQGYTHRGQGIGAAIGPSGSSQWIAGDLFGDRWHVGAFGGRIRWENEARATYLPEFRRADVSLFAGIRAGTDLGPFTVAAEYTSMARYNYLFQAQPVDDGEHRGVDIPNHTLKVTVFARDVLR